MWHGTWGWSDLLDGDERRVLKGIDEGDNKEDGSDGKGYQKRHRCVEGLWWVYSRGGGWTELGIFISLGKDLWELVNNDKTPWIKWGCRLDTLTRTVLKRWFVIKKPLS